MSTFTIRWAGQYGMVPVLVDADSKQEAAGLVGQFMRGPKSESVQRELDALGKSQSHEWVFDLNEMATISTLTGECREDVAKLAWRHVYVAEVGTTSYGQQAAMSSLYCEENADGTWRAWTFAVQFRDRDGDVRLDGMASVEDAIRMIESAVRGRGFNLAATTWRRFYAAQAPAVLGYRGTKPTVHVVQKDDGLWDCKTFGFMTVTAKETYGFLVPEAVMEVIQDLVDGALQEIDESPMA